MYIYIVLHFVSHIVTGVSSEESSGHLIVVLRMWLSRGAPEEADCYIHTYRIFQICDVAFWWILTRNYLLMTPKSTSVKNYRNTFHAELSNVSISFCAVSGIWAEQTYKNSMVHCSQWCYCTVERVKRNAGKYESESGKIIWASLLFLTRIWPSLDLFLHVRLHIIFQMLTLLYVSVVAKFSVDPRDSILQVYRKKKKMKKRCKQKWREGKKEEKEEEKEKKEGRKKTIFTVKFSVTNV